MAASTAPAVKAALLTQLAARTGLAGVGIHWAAPVDSHLYAQSGEDIFLGDVSRDEEWLVLGGTRPRDEHYRLTVVVQAYRKGNDPQATETRCWALVEELAALLRDDPTVGGAITVPAREEPYAQLDGAEMVTRPTEPEGWLAKSTVRVAVGARI